jgi:hypothetical protein
VAFFQDSQLAEIPFSLPGMCNLAHDDNPVYQAVACVRAYGI